MSVHNSISLPSTPATDTTRAVARQRAVAPGNVAADMWSVAFTNVGSAVAQVAGADLSPGESTSFSGYFDATTNQNVRLPAIPYTASATAILSISTQA